MRKWNRTIEFVALMVVGLAPAAVRAEYGSYSAYSSSFNSNIGKAESALRPAGAALGSAAGAGGAAGDPLKQLTADLEAKVEEAGKTIQRSEDERKLRAKVRGGTKTIDGLKTALTLPEIITSKKLKDLERRNNQDLQFINQLQASTQGISSADIDMSRLDSGCRSGVDFGQFKQLADQMGSEPFRYLREQGNQLIEERNKEVKEAKIQNLQKLAAAFEKAAEQDNGTGDLQQELQKADLFKNDNSLEASLRNLNDTWNKQKKQIKDLRKDLVKSVFTDFIPKLTEFKANDERVGQLAAFFADNLEQYRRATLDSAVQGAQQLYANCKKKVDELGRGNPQAGRSWLNSAYRFAAQADPQFANSQLAPMLAVISRQASERCVDVVPNLDALFGANLQNAINQVRTMKDPRTLLQGAMATMQAVGAAQAQVGQVLDPLMAGCQFATDKIKQMQDYIGQVSAQIAEGGEGSGQPGQPGSRRTGARRGASAGTASRTGGPATHNGAGGRRSF